MVTAIRNLEDPSATYSAEESRRRILARLFFATCWLLVFTGALRKWAFPNANVLYVFPDVPIAIGYVYALVAGMVRRTLLLGGFLILSSVILIQGFLQIILKDLKPFMALVGFHHYLFYIPIMIVFPSCLTEVYRRRFIFWNLLLTLPMTALALLQAVSPQASPINATASGETMGLPGSDAVRATGTFNFTLYFGLWIALAVSLAVGEWLVPREQRAIKNRYLLALCTIAANVCYLASGSRTAILMSGLAISGGILAAVLMGSKRVLATVAGLLLVMPILVALVAVLVPNEFQIIVERFTGDEYVAEAQGRTLDIAVGFLTDPPFSLIGAGIGMGIDAAHFGENYNANFLYQSSEWDTIRIVYEEGTLVGLFYDFTRIAFSLGMVFLAIQIVRKGGVPHVLPIAMYCFAQVYLQDLTRLGSMTSGQVAIAYAFILSVYLYPHSNAEQGSATKLISTRFA